MKIIQRCSET